MTGRPSGTRSSAGTAPGRSRRSNPTTSCRLLALVESRAAALGVTPLTLEVPMLNGVAMRHLLDRGFRMDAFFTFLMASRPFGQFDRYVVFGPPFVL